MWKSHSEKRKQRQTQQKNLQTICKIKEGKMGKPHETSDHMNKAFRKETFIVRGKHSTPLEVLRHSFQIVQNKHVNNHSHILTCTDQQNQVYIFIIANQTLKTRNSHNIYGTTFVITPPPPSTSRQIKVIKLNILVAWRATLEVNN